jgi:RHS repeat-associated protein
MFKKTALYTIVVAITLIVLNNAGYGQQNNKPANTTPASPVVEPLPNGYTTDLKVNYIRSWEPVGPITDPGTVISSGYQHVKQITQYLDGLGRPLQTVSKQITPGTQPKDMVAPVKYDEFGREVINYLPYVSTENNGLLKTDPFLAQKTFMLALYPDEQVYYSKTNYEASPLNRVTKTMAPGNSWAGSNMGVSMDYQLNTTPDAVRIWTITSNPITYSNNDISTNIPSSAAFYNAGKLYKNVSSDEAGNAIVEFKDKQGQVVLKKVQVGNIPTDYSGYEGFLCTYYVYDYLNQLRFVIPPKAVEAIRSNWQFNDNNIINELCFRYEYDSRNRMIAKKIPGAGWVYMIYDTRDRLVFTQDAKLRKNNLWLTTLYDGLNRAVMTGMITWNGLPSTLQQTVTWQTTSLVTPPGLQSDRELPEPGQTIPISGTFQATNSVTLKEEFESAAEFTAEIVGGTNGGPENITIEGTTINKNPIPSGAGFIALTKTYYDSYYFTNITYSTAYNGYLDAGSNLHPEAMPSAANTQTKGLVTGSSVRIIEDPNNLAAGNWLTTVNFYDDKGRVIQTNSDNHKGGKDIITNRYDFTGKVISGYLDHTNPGGTPTSVHVKTNMEYDHAGRLLEVWKTINDDNLKKTQIVKNDYDELGQLRNKKLGPKNDGSVYIESLDYSYNIRGWLTGINKDYANNTGNPNAWFGMELNYDKGFQISQLNGNIAGTKWRSRGDGERRAYGYTYDKVNRILGADFSQSNGSNYVDNANINFDMKMGDGLSGTEAYDANGNIKLMTQWGLKLSNSSPIDELQYEYFDYSNKLKRVTDTWNDNNSKLGDFKYDPNTKGANDYGYDLNGNMITDMNKKLNGDVGKDIDLTTGGTGAIRYNYLNLPYQIVAAGRGLITYSYDAAGNKLKKVVRDSTAGKVVTTTTSYVGGLVYESKTTNPADAGDYTERLQFISHEEGRTRYIAAEGSNPASFVYDYFVKDHLGNVRMVLTEEQKTNIYQAGMEDANRSFEVVLFDQKINSTATPKPGGFDSDGGNAKVSMVNGTTVEGRVGPGIVLKVMSGDKINARTLAWYQPSGMDNTTTPGLTAIIENILGQLTSGISGAGKGTANEEITRNILQPGMQSLLNAQNPASGAPKAYLNWILFDEERFTAVSSGFVAVPQITGGQQKVLIQANGGNDIDIPRNGYLYVYVSNESRGNVYFDDIRVEHKRGSLIEETHYYPFGLTMAGISSRALGNVENKKKFNGIEQNTDLDLNQYDAFYRNLDPQLGRWWQVDPKPNDMESPYAAMGNNPILNMDYLGDTSVLGRLWNNVKEGWKDFDNGKGTAYEAVDWINRNLNPLTDLYHTTSGKDFITGEQVSRTEAAANVAMALIPGGKVEGAVVKTVEKTVVEKTVQKGVVSLDNNILIKAIEGGEKELVKKAIGGAKPIVSITAAKEYLVKGNKSQLRDFMTEINATISKNGASAGQVQQLQAQAVNLGRRLGTNDASIIGGAINNNATVITYDRQMINFMNAIGLPVKTP